MVFPGAVLHAEADPEPRLDLRRRDSGNSRLWIIGRLLGRASILGDGPNRCRTDAAGDGSGDRIGELPRCFHRIGVLQMKAPAIFFLLAPLSLLAQGTAKNTCVDCHAALDG